MTTVYMAEVDTDKGTKYVGKNGKLGAVPIFFQLPRRLQYLLRNPQDRVRDQGYYTPSRDAHKTRVIIVSDLEKGLRASTGLNLSTDEFLRKGFWPATKYAPPKNAVFKIQLNYDIKKKFIGRGKFGKTWQCQGDLRLHLTNNLHRLIGPHPFYKNAQVVTIEIGDDGITPDKITYTPIVDFYEQSPVCRERLAKLHRTSLSSFNENAIRLKTFA